MWKRGYTEQPCESKNKTNKNLGFWVTASRMLEQVYVRMNSACMCKLDHVYTNPYPGKPKNTETEHNFKTTN